MTTIVPQGSTLICQRVKLALSLPRESTSD
jgi:hypothetical protein